MVSDRCSAPSKKKVRTKRFYSVFSVLQKSASIQGEARLSKFGGPEHTHLEIWTYLGATALMRVPHHHAGDYLGISQGKHIALGISAYPEVTRVLIESGARLTLKKERSPASCSMQ